MEKNKENGPIELVYPKAAYSKRFIALFVELFFLIITTLGFFFLGRVITESSSTYQNAFDTYIRISAESGLFIYGEETSYNLVTLTEYYTPDGTSLNEVGYQSVNSSFEDALISFYSNPTFFTQDPNDQDNGLAIYRRQKLGDTAIGKSDGIVYFLGDIDGNPQQNPSISATDFHNFYIEAYDKACSYISNADGYIEARNVISQTVNFIILPVSLLGAFLIWEFLIPSTFLSRGKQNIGMKLMNISLLTEKAVSPSFGRFAIRQAILFFGEYLLSMVTFGIPILVSFTMWVFRKDGQTFHDYVSGLYYVDSSSQSIYKSPAERAYLLAKAERIEKESFLNANGEKPLGENSTWNKLVDNHKDAPKD